MAYWDSTSSSSSESEYEEEFVKCESCEKSMPISAYEKHSRKKHVVCRYCDVTLLDENWDDHSEKCRHGPVRCKYCPNIMPPRSMEGHIERKHPEKIKPKEPSGSNNNRGRNVVYVSDAKLIQLMRNNQIETVNGDLFLRD